MNELNVELFQNRLKSALKDKKMTQKELAIKAKISVSIIEKWLQKNNQKNLPSLTNIYKVSQVLGVSIDYFVNPDMNCKTVINQQISDYLGLSDDAIKGLKYVKKYDEVYSKNASSGLCILPTLNRILAQKVAFTELLDSIRLFFAADYTVPIFHDRNGKPKKSNSPWDIIKGVSFRFSSIGKRVKVKVKSNKTNDLYIQHFAKADDLNDSIPVTINETFIKSVAMDGIKQKLDEMAAAK